MISGAKPCSFKYYYLILARFAVEVYCCNIYPVNTFALPDLLVLAAIHLTPVPLKEKSAFAPVWLVDFIAPLLHDEQADADHVPV